MYQKFTYKCLGSEATADKKFNEKKTIEEEHDERLRKILEKYKDEPADKYVFVQIYT